ncbi:MAG: polyprenyl diphosphate synthase [Ghiorsea sp.]|nr:polyprenyl diphosphate synthase [Ghiorsea sp.]MDQ7059099.1 polyprenyl diphosphate synthase [Ghiorsea sp.]
MSSPEGLSLQRVAKHVAIIMDGNGRWAKAQGLSRLEGHKQGAKRLHDVIQWAKDAGVKQVSLYAFSTENWKRPKLEIAGLMTLLATLLPLEVPKMQEKGARLLILGDISKFPWLARRALNKAVQATKNNTKIDVILCLNYGGQQEIVDGIKTFYASFDDEKERDKAFAELTPEILYQNLGRDEILPVDLLIRTGGEKRISNFHLWDAAYAELYFTDTNWPAYSQQDLMEALQDFASRERRFGKTSEQVQAGVADE